MRGAVPGCADPSCRPTRGGSSAWIFSEGMLSHAREKHFYDELVRAELTEYLRANQNQFDLIVSADTLVYFGDLQAVFAALSAALRPNGVFVCTLEHAIGASPCCSSV